jgi:hypothetical protein
MGARRRGKRLGGGISSAIGRGTGFAVLAVCLVLAACGDDDDDNEPSSGTGRNEGSPVTTNLGDASPVASPRSLPQDAESATVTIEGGKLDPDRVTGQTGLPFILIVNGDGAQHTLAIEDLVSGATINAEGATEVTFTVSDDTTGELTITLDGEEAGTFVAQGPGGIVGE